MFIIRKPIYLNIDDPRHTGASKLWLSLRQYLLNKREKKGKRRKVKPEVLALEQILYDRILEGSDKGYSKITIPLKNTSTEELIFLRQSDVLGSLGEVTLETSDFLRGLNLVVKLEKPKPKIKSTKKNSLLIGLLLSGFLLSTGVMDTSFADNVSTEIDISGEGEVDIDLGEETLEIDVNSNVSIKESINISVEFPPIQQGVVSVLGLWDLNNLAGSDYTTGDFEIKDDPLIDLADVVEKLYFTERSKEGSRDYLFRDSGLDITSDTIRISKSFWGEDRSKPVMKKDLLLALGQIYQGVKESRPLLIYSTPKRYFPDKKLYKVTSVLAEEYPYLEKLANIGLDFINSEIRVNYTNFGDYYVYRNPNVYELYFQSFIEEGVISKTEFTDSTWMIGGIDSLFCSPQKGTLFPNGFRDKIEGPDDSRRQWTWRVSNPSKEQNSYRDSNSYTGGRNPFGQGWSSSSDLKSFSKSNYSFFDKELMTNEEALKLIVKVTSKYDLNLSDLELDLLEFKYGLDLTSQDLETRKALLTLIGLGVIDHDSYFVDNLYKPFTLEDALPLLERLRYPNRRLDFKKIQLTQEDSILKTLGYKQSKVTISEGDDSPESVVLGDSEVGDYDPFSGNSSGSDDSDSSGNYLTFKILLNNKWSLSADQVGLWYPTIQKNWNKCPLKSSDYFSYVDSTQGSLIYTLKIREDAFDYLSSQGEVELNSSGASDKPEKIGSLIKGKEWYVPSNSNSDLKAFDNFDDAYNYKQSSISSFLDKLFYTKKVYADNSGLQVFKLKTRLNKLSDGFLRYMFEGKYVINHFEYKSIMDGDAIEAVFEIPAKSLDEALAIQDKLLTIEKGTLQELWSLESYTKVINGDKVTLVSQNQIESLGLVFKNDKVIVNPRTGVTALILVDKGVVIIGNNITLYPKDTLSVKISNNTVYYNLDIVKGILGIDNIKALGLNIYINKSIEDSFKYVDIYTDRGYKVDTTTTVDDTKVGTLFSLTHLNRIGSKYFLDLNYIDPSVLRRPPVVLEYNLQSLNPSDVSISEDSLNLFEPPSSQNIQEYWELNKRVNNTIMSKILGTDVDIFSGYEMLNIIIPQAQEDLFWDIIEDSEVRDIVTGNYTSFQSLATAGLMSRRIYVNNLPSSPLKILYGNIYGELNFPYKWLDDTSIQVEELPLNYLTLSSFACATKLEMEGGWTMTIMSSKTTYRGENPIYVLVHIDGYDKVPLDIKKYFITYEGDTKFSEGHHYIPDYFILKDDDNNFKYTMEKIGGSSSLFYQYNLTLRPNRLNDLVREFSITEAPISIKDIGGAPINVSNLKFKVTGIDESAGLVFLKSEAIYPKGYNKYLKDLEAFYNNGQPLSKELVQTFVFEYLTRIVFKANGRYYPLTYLCESADISEYNSTGVEVLYKENDKYYIGNINKNTEGTKISSFRIDLAVKGSTLVLPDGDGSFIISSMQETSYAKSRANLLEGEVLNFDYNEEETMWEFFGRENPDYIGKESLVGVGKYEVPGPIKKILVVISTWSFICGSLVIVIYLNINNYLVGRIFSSIVSLVGPFTFGVITKGTMEGMTATRATVITFLFYFMGMFLIRNFLL